MDLALAHLAESRLAGQGRRQRAPVGGEPVATGRALPRRQGATARRGRARFGADHPARRRLEADRRGAQHPARPRGGREDRGGRLLPGRPRRRAAAPLARGDRRVRPALRGRSGRHAPRGGLPGALRRVLGRNRCARKQCAGRAARDARHAAAQRRRVPRPGACQAARRHARRLARRAAQAAQQRPARYRRGARRGGLWAGARAAARRGSAVARRAATSWCSTRTATRAAPARAPRRPKPTRQTTRRPLPPLPPPRRAASAYCRAARPRRGTCGWTIAPSRCGSAIPCSSTWSRRWPKRPGGPARSPSYRAPISSGCRRWRPWCAGRAANASASARCA